jgi:hypothetical protein
MRSLLICLVLPLRIGGQTPLPAVEQARVLPLNRPRFTHPDLSSGWLQMETAIGDDYFDGASSVERVRRHFKVAHELGVKYLRCGFSWNAIEKSQGVYDWRFWDMLVEESERAHIELMPYVAYTPQWASGAHQEFWNQPPRNDDLYADFMYQAVSRYRGKVHIWEIWNEPDNREYWQSSAERYAHLVSEAAISMRKADPSIVLVLGGMSRGPSEFFRDSLEKFHIDRYVDVIAIHGYPETWGQERIEHVYHDWIPKMSEWIRNEGSGVALWANELGYADFRFSSTQASKWGGSVFYDYEHTSSYAADFLFKSEIMALASGRVTLTGWYRIDDFTLDTPHVSDDEVNFHLGLFDSKGNAKPSFYALKFFNELFDQPVQRVDAQVGRPGGSQSNVALFRRKDGKLILIGWLCSSEPSQIAAKTGMLKDSRKEDVSVQVPCRSISQLRQYDAEGHPVPTDLSLAADHSVEASLRGDHVSIAVMNCGQ